MSILNSYIEPLIPELLSFELALKCPPLSLIRFLDDFSNSVCPTSRGLLMIETLFCHIIQVIEKWIVVSFFNFAYFQ